MRAAAPIIALAILLAGPWPAARADDVAPGTRIEIAPQDMPAPYATPRASNPPRTVGRPMGVRPQVPEGFSISLFAAGLENARALAVAPNGDVFIAEPKAGRVTVLRDADDSGIAERKTTFVRGLLGPHGLAIRPGALYVGDLHGVWRIDYQPGDLKARGEPERITPPGAFGVPGGHWTRNIAFAPDGSAFFVAIGSAGNIAEDPEPRATVQIFDADGGGQRTYASGLRNPVGIAFHPHTHDLYVVVNERDGLGDELVPDYLTRIEDGDFFGWPYAYIGGNPQPGYAEKRPDLVEKSQVPDLLFRSHSAPLGLTFYDADAFPEAYRGDAFVALHGSWNAEEPRGYMVARVPFENGRPVGHYEAFVTGFWIAGEDRAEVWGRPAGVAVAADGSLLVADDVGNTIWRVSPAP